MSHFASYAFRITRCDSCNASKGSMLSHCTRCLSVAFCDEACQRKAWPEHKRECRSLGIEVLQNLQARANIGDGAALADLGIVYSAGYLRVAANGGDAALAWARGAALGNESAARFLAARASESPDAALDITPSIRGSGSTSSTESGARLESRPSVALIASLDTTLKSARAAADSNDIDRAIALYQECTASSYHTCAAQALYGLGLIYLHHGRAGASSGPPDEKLALSFFNAAADAAVAGGLAGEPRAASAEAKMLAEIVLCDYKLVFAGYPGDAAPASELRSSVLARSLPVLLRAWSLDGAAVSPYLCALVAVGYATGAGARLDMHEAREWTSRSFSPAPMISWNRSAFDTRQLAALSTLRDAHEYLLSIDAPRAGEFWGGIHRLIDRVAREWAGSRTDTSREISWFCARGALSSARDGVTPFATAHNMLKLAAAEDSGCAACKLYIAYNTGSDGIARNAPTAARWAARCRALEHSIRGCPKCFP